MSRKKLFQLVSAALLVFGLALAIPGLDWQDVHSKFAYSSLSLGTIGSISSIFIPSNYVLFYNPEDWIKDKNEASYSLFLNIKAAKHGQGTSPTVEFYITEEDGSSHLAETGVKHDNQGNVTLEINGIYDICYLTGKVVIS